MAANKEVLTHHGTLVTYSIGFVLSLMLTITAYLAVTKQLFTGDALLVVIIGLAIAQLLAQLLFFLHLGDEMKPRWKLVVFWFMLVVLGILVFGSLWIMQNLDYNMMNGHELDTYIIRDEGMHDH